LTANICVSCDNKSCPVFNQGKEAKEIISKNTVRIGFKKDEMLFKQGAFSTHLYYINSGYTKIYKEFPSKNLILKIANPEMILGTASLFGTKTHLYSASFIGKGEVCQIDRNIFAQLLLKNPENSLELLLNQLYKSESEVFSRFASLTQKQLHGRLADAILYLSMEVFKSDRFEFPFTRRDLAELTSMSNESAIKIFKEFQNDGIVSLENNVLHILSLDLLKRISEIG